MPIYQQLNLMNLCQIYKLEILKFMLKYKNKTLPNCFKNYFISPSETHNYPTRFACDDNWAAAFQHKKLTSKCSIRYNGYKIAYGMNYHYKLKGCIEKVILSF